jgi:GTP-binding protein EngB required for normal cell division
MTILDLWDKLYRERLDWAFNAQRNFFDSFQDHHVRRMFQTAAGDQQEVFVAVFGPSQVGKTTLILRLIGLDLAYISRVGSALRGGRETGRSSTVTSMLYCASPDDFYYVKGLPGNGIEKCRTESEIRSCMRLLREKVEQGVSFTVEPVEIRIPRKYFVKDESSRTMVTIVDLPGIYSSSQEEHDHVQKVIDYYLPRANMVILVNQANQLASFSSFGIEAVDQWKYVPDKFRIVLTHSVSNDSIRRMIDKGISPEKFRRHFYDEFDVTIEEFPSDIKVYALEYGDSWERLITTKAITPSLEKMMDDLFCELREDIAGSADIYSQLRINYKLFGAVKKQLESKEQGYKDFQQGLQYILDGIQEQVKVQERDLIQLRSAYELARDTLTSMRKKRFSPERSDPLLCPSEGSETVSRLRTAIREALEAVIKAANKQIAKYESEMDEFTLVLRSPFASIPKVTESDFEDTVQGMRARLNRYKLDMYFFRWEEDFQDTNEVIKEVWSHADRIVRDRIKQARDRLDAALVDHQRKWMNRVKSAEADYGVMKQKEKEQEQRLEAAKAVYGEFLQQAAHDLSTARRFQRFIETGYQEARLAAIQAINSTETPTTQKLIYLAYLQLLVNEFMKVEVGK